MPNLDKTGPEGKGKKTGRKLGLCDKKESVDETRKKLMSRRFKQRRRVGY